MSIFGGRFFQLSNALFCYQLTPIQFTVYSFLVSSGGQKKVCWPSMKTIAANCGCSVNAVRDAVRVLEQMGFIRCVKRYRDLANGSVRQTSNSYFILDPPPLSIARRRVTPEGGGEMYEQDEGEQIKPSAAGQVPA